MSHPGVLLQYGPAPAQTAFLFGTETQSLSRCVLFIGGLGDGFLPTPYLGSLARRLAPKLGLVTVGTRSSLGGFGTSSLAQDVEDIDLVIEHLQKECSCHSFVIFGHSTGCQDAVFHARNGKQHKEVHGLVLQAPVSDREWLTSQPGCDELLLRAKSMISAGDASGILPGADKLLEAPVTAARFLSLAGVGGEDDMFSSDFQDEDLRARLGHVGVPVLIATSLNDEYIPESVDKRALTERLCSAFQAAVAPVRWSDALRDGVRQVYLESNHGIQDEPEREKLIARVIEFLDTLPSAT